MRVLVTGGTGFLGRALVRTLVARGHEPVVFARSARASGLPGTLVDGDVRDGAAVVAAARGCEVIAHAAALVAVWRRRRVDFDDVNVGGLRNVIAAAVAAGVARLLYTSSFLALPPNGSDAPQRSNDYQRTKVEGDALADRAVAEGVPLIRVYPGVIYGPGERTEGNLVGGMIADHLAHRLPGLVGGDRRWSYAYIDDVAAGHVSALERGDLGGRYYLGGENAQLIRLFEIVRQVTGTALPRRLPYSLMRVVAALDLAKANLTGSPPRITPGTLKILSCDWELDSSQAERHLGYRITPLDAGVRATLDTLR